MQILEGLPLKFLIRELKPMVVGARIQDIFLLPRKGFVLRLYNQNLSNGYLVSCFHPDMNTLFFSNNSPDRKLNLTNHWIQTTRRNLLGGYIVEIEQVGWDRVVKLLIKNSSLWESSEKQFFLFFELTGRNANLVLVETGSQRILSAARFIGQRESSFRHVFPGLVYSPPPCLGSKIDPLIFLESGVSPGIEEAVIDGPRWFINNFDGVGTFLSRYLWRKMENRPISYETIREVWKEVLQPLLKEDYKLYLFLERISKKPLGIFWKEDGYLDAEVLAFPSFKEALETYFYALQDWYKQHELQEKKIKELQKELEAVRWEKEKIASLLPNEEEIEMARLKGELLKLWPHLEVIKQDNKGLTVRNILSQVPEEVCISLEPALSIAQNMQNYFQLYRKLLKRATMVKDKLTVLERKESEILHKLEALVGDSEEISCSRLSEEKVSSSQRFPSGITGYCTPGGNYILIGKNARANHLLISKVASRRDLWFHAREMPGSHVILKIVNSSRGVEDDIERAAKVAAFYSRGRNENVVPVIMTEVRHLRFASGSNLGEVLFKNEKTLFVRPEFPLGLEAC